MVAPGRSPTRRRSSSSTSTRACSRSSPIRARRPRRRREQLHQDRQADLLADQRHALAGDRRPRDAAWSSAYRLAVEETPFIQQIRNNVITFITPVIEVDGREKQVDTYYFNKKRAAGRRAAAADVLGQVRRARQQPRRHGPVPRADAARRRRRSSSGSPPSCTTCTRRRPYLYTSTGTGPYNEALDPITVDEWWLLAKNEVMEMTKRGVPGVWTYGFYDGWTPELHVLHRAHAQRDRPLLRGAELRARQLRGARRRHDDEPRVVPPEPAAAVDQVGPAQQHQHPAVGRAARAQPRREEPRDVPRELLAEEQARRRRRARTARSTPGSFPRRSAARPTPPTR